MPEEWALDDNATLYLGAKNGPRLFVAVVRADASGEVNETDIEHGAKAGSNIEHGGGVGLISDNRDAESGDEPYEAANVIEDSVLAQSTITQPVNNSQRRSSTLTKPIFSEANKSGVNSKKPKQVSVAGSAASVVAKTNDVERVVVPESSVAAETKKTGSDGIDESDQVTGEHAATVVGFDPTGPDPAGLADNRQGNEPHDVVPSVTGQIKVPSEIDLREPSVTGQVPVGKTALDPQITGPIEPQSADSVASKAQAVGVVIGSAALAFLVWALISLLI